MPVLPEPRRPKSGGGVFLCSTATVVVGPATTSVPLHQVGGKRAEQRPQEQHAASCIVASAYPGAPRRHGGPRRASSGFIPPLKPPLPLVPRGALLRAPGRFRSRGGCRGYPGPALTLGRSRGGVCGEVLLLERVLR